MAKPSINIDTSRKDETAKIVVYGVVALAVVGLAYFGIIKPILNAVGLTKTKEDREADQIQDKLSRQQVLSPLLYTQNKDKITISSQKAYENASNIYDAKWGGAWYLSDDEDLAVGSITNTGSKVNISYVSYIFNKTYGKSMEAYLTSFLENENWVTIDNYIDKIKTF